MTDAADILRKTVAAGAPLLEALTEEATGCPRAPGKWSPREVLGHLVDSAANNHIRFVRSQFEEDLIFEGYDQDEWVRVQAYCEAPWIEIVELWRAYNVLLARIIEAIPADVRRRARPRHNFHRIGWKKFSEEEPASLDELIADYVDHLRHHVGQLVPLPELESPPES